MSLLHPASSRSVLRAGSGLPCLLMLSNMLEPRVEKDRFATGKEEYDGTKNRENDHSDLGYPTTACERLGERDDSSLYTLRVYAYAQLSRR
jgi:hypothetical protein